MKDTADAMYFAVTQVESVDKITQWIKDNPKIAVHGIYPDNGQYLIVHWKTFEEIIELKKEI